MYDGSCGVAKAVQLVDSVCISFDTSINALGCGARSCINLRLQYKLFSVVWFIYPIKIGMLDKFSICYRFLYCSGGTLSRVSTRL